MRIVGAGVLALFTLAACVGPAGLMTSEPRPTAQQRESTQFRLAKRSTAWSAQPGVTTLLRRVIPGEQQQLIGLANDTTIAGDNFLLLVAYGRAETVPKAPDLERILERVGGVPEPFTRFSDADLNQRSDALGPYFWTELTRSGAGACVLAFRRLGLQARMLPAGTAAMEAVLRNCVQGSVDEALAPLRAKRLAFARDAAVVNGTVRPRVLNPLAAPGR